MSLDNLKSLLLSQSRFMGLRPSSAAAGEDAVEPALAGPGHGLLVELVQGTYEIATSALQTAANTLLGYIAPGMNTRLVSVASVNYEPGVPFTLTVMSKGILKVMDAGGHQFTLTTTVDGYTHSGLLLKIYKDAANTASGLYVVY